MNHHPSSVVSDISPNTLIMSPSSTLLSSLLSPLFSSSPSLICVGGLLLKYKGSIVVAHHLQYIFLFSTPPPAVPPTTNPTSLLMTKLNSTTLSRMSVCTFTFYIIIIIILEKYKHQHRRDFCFILLSQSKSCPLSPTHAVIIPSSTFSPLYSLLYSRGISSGPA
jgi:hypothetical protein